MYLINKIFVYLMFSSHGIISLHLLEVCLYWYVFESYEYTYILNFE